AEWLLERSAGQHPSFVQRRRSLRGSAEGAARVVAGWCAVVCRSCMHAPCRLPQIHLIGPSMRSPGGTVPRRREVAAVDVEGEDPGTQADSESRAVVGAFAAAPGERPGQEGVDRG